MPTIYCPKSKVLPIVTIKQVIILTEQSVKTNWKYPINKNKYFHKSFYIEML